MVSGGGHPRCTGGVSAVSDGAEIVVGVHHAAHQRLEVLRIPPRREHPSLTVAINRYAFAPDVHQRSMTHVTLIRQDCSKGNSYSSKLWFRAMKDSSDNADCGIISVLACAGVCPFRAATGSAWRGVRVQYAPRGQVSPRVQVLVPFWAEQ